jgi:hypothetical protein
VTQVLETTPVPAAPPTRPWRRLGWATLALGQAAAILVAGWLVLGPRPGPDQVPKIKLEAGELVLLQSDGPEVKVVSRVRDEGSSSIDLAFVQLGIFEAMAE